MKNTSIWLAVVSLILSVVVGLTLARGNGEIKDKSRKNVVIGLSMGTLKEARAS